MMAYEKIESHAVGRGKAKTRLKQSVIPSLNRR